MQSATPSSDLCILLTSWDGQKWVVPLVEALIAKYWNPSPPLFVCGCRESSRPDVYLPLGRDERDWIGILRDACEALLGKGMKQVYLMPDDHPPLARCHVEVLNRSLPRMLEASGGLNIGLNGCGQGRPDAGGQLSKEFDGLEEVGEWFEWKYSLHPGLWDLEKLYRLACWAEETVPIKERTAWKFERLGAKHSTKELFGEAYRSFRVDGRKLARLPLMSLRARMRWSLAKGCYGLRGRFLLLGGDRTPKQQDHEEKGRFLFRFYEGPYPLYWSGLLQRGAVNPDCMRFLKLTRQQWVIRKLLAAMPTG